MNKHWPSSYISDIFGILCRGLSICHIVCGFLPILDSVCFLGVFMLSTVALCCIFWFLVDCNCFMWLIETACFFTVCMSFSRVIFYLLLFVAFVLLGQLLQ